jgi:DNA-directed RNA polymerase subunit L
MEVKILSNEKNVLELELVGSDTSLAQLISERLNQDKDVEFASFKVEHPLLAHPKLFVRTKKGDASKLVLGVIDEIKKELVDFRKQFAEISK